MLLQLGPSDVGGVREVADDGQRELLQVRICRRCYFRCLDN